MTLPACLVICGQDGPALTSDEHPHRRDRDEADDQLAQADHLDHRDVVAPSDHRLGNRHSRHRDRAGEHLCVHHDCSERKSNSGELEQIIRAQRCCTTPLSVNLGSDERNRGHRPSGEDHPDSQGWVPPPWRANQLGHEATAPATDIEPHLDCHQRQGDEHGQQPRLPGRPNATPPSTPMTPSSTMARRVRGSDRSRRRSMSASFSGVRTRNARKAAAPIATPAHENARTTPSSTGSSVSPHPPCSDGTATARHGACGAAVERWPGDAVAVTLSPSTFRASSLQAMTSVHRVLAPAQHATHRAPPARSRCCGLRLGFVDSADLDRDRVCSAHGDFAV